MDTNGTDLLWVSLRLAEPRPRGRGSISAPCLWVAPTRGWISARLLAGVITGWVAPGGRVARLPVRIHGDVLGE